ncbi:uncharacterized protein LACBIDRAFT_307636 [Laccaria bicolor S238N-H82]|uniref:Predicted protein n=1 Tax=Laccaria bicolor (strain S238N-H82 / ATCC MYA-4686) TaxID=486041 RepID=B0DQM4_LACBS|nr:uncharacterized protein LACBIDRAFT_307636 [Laccaria bicolor S238N-H82]EDR03142.1 predicted protein [Laccaria bicolor S238N-H82]|eukprot:XP_001886283.1 predicted protein [Laccaria bicolor S238N-H82]
MATQRSPHTTSSIPAQPKRSPFSSAQSLIPHSARRPSTSSVTSNHSPISSQGIGASPTIPPTTPAGSGIPAFRSLRSLLPFGPGRNATPNSSAASPNTSRSPFSGFGSVRRSMTKDRERKTSLSNDALIMPVMAIGKPLNDEEQGVRRSASLSRLDNHHPGEPENGDFVEELLAHSGMRMLRTPSPGPPLSLDLSTIMEADSSGISKYVPVLSTNATPAESRSSSPTIINPNLLHASFAAPPTTSGHSDPTTPDTRSSDGDADTSALDLCTTHIATQVIDAMRASNHSADAQEWLNSDKAIIIDGDDHPEVVDSSFSMDINLESVDPALAALLSPNSATTAKPYIPSPQSSPTTPKSPFRVQRSRQSSSFLPRLRPPNTPSPTTSAFPTTPLSTAIPSSSSAGTTPNESPTKGKETAVNGNKGIHGSPPSSPSSPIRRSSAPTSSTPAAQRRTMAFAHPPKSFTPSSTSSFSAATAVRVFGAADKGVSGTPSGSGIAKGRAGARTLRQVILGGPASDSKKPGSEAVPLSAPPLISFSSPPSPSRVSAALGRGSLDSRRSPVLREARPSLDVQRPGLETTSTPRGSFEKRRIVSGSMPGKRTGLGGGNFYMPRGSTSPEREDFGTGGESSSPSPPMGGEDATSYYRPSLDSSRPSLDSTSHSGSAARLRSPSLRIERSHSDNNTVHGNASNNRLSPMPSAGRVRKRSMSVQERLGRGSKLTADRERDKGMMAEFGVSRPSSSLSMGRSASSRLGGGGDGPKAEWLGPRTAKAFRAAGLLDFEREREEGSDPSSTEKAFATRDRSGSAATVPSPLGNGGGSVISGGRFGSLRGTSEFGGGNSGGSGSGFGRSHSRMALSEAGGGSAGRRGSGTFSAYGAGGGLLESPTFTVSSGSRDRDTPRSTTSTAPTSISGSFGYLGRDRGERDRDREREKEEIRELRDKHQLETGALLGALSDSQRTVRVLREENSDLRERVERLADAEAENDELRRVCSELRQECTDLRRECVELRREMRLGATRTPSGLGNSWSNASSSGYRTPVPVRQKQGPSGRLQAQWNRDRDDQDRLLTVPTEDQHPPILDFDEEAIEPEDDDEDDEEPPSAEPTSLLPAQRRLSTTSSIFPVLPPNMTMLLHEDAAHPGDLSGSNRSSMEQSHFRFPPSSHKQPQPQPHGFRGMDGGGHTANMSISSAASISPTTANFSMVTGSPGSLFLRPEHEVLLGEMESLDLGVRGGDGELESRSLDGW